ncbi:MAG: RsmB/NOP family class I SAM-dependent RNA methyltransferase [Christensenellales bacterium]
MISINEAKRKLPTDFIENIYELYDLLKVDQILQGMMNPRNTTIRVNTIKYNIQDLMRYFKEKNIKFERVLWYRDALIIKNATEKELQKLEIYEKGYIYLQSLSSMVPPLVLNPKKGEKVLDLTAAPGSKTTQMAALMENEGYILANELDKIRSERLQYNVKSQGAEIVEVINGRGEKIGNSYPEYFDKVLLDTPCSGEGRFLLGKPMTYKDWSLKKVNQLVKIQKKLFESAYNATKKNGIMVYSTCTINKEENEYILDWAINNFDIKLLEINLNIKEAIKGDNTGLNGSIDKAIKILPSKNMEGFFVAKIVKN